MYSFAPLPAAGGRVYPERETEGFHPPSRFTTAVKGSLGAWVNPRWTRFRWVIEATRRYADRAAQWDAEAVLAKSRRLALSLREEGLSVQNVGQAFAMIREVADRTIGLRHRDVQLVGGAVMLAGMVAEMETGEGKTLSATLPACTVALSGVPVHIVTVNDYLAQRDAQWMKPIYAALGLRVGAVIHGMPPVDRREAYRCDITYCTNKELAFDYLRDRIVLWDRPTSLRMQIERLFGAHSRMDKLLLPGLFYAIIDEADSVLIDEARTPLIISSEGENAYTPEIYAAALAHARQLDVDVDFHIASGDHTLDLSKKGRHKIHLLEWPESAEDLSQGQREALLRQALVALHLYHRDIHYLVHEQKIQIVDEYTGRLMADRSWEQGLHQLIELKEGCPATPQKETRARISYQRFFRRYLRLAGMTGTATEVAGELQSIYDLNVVRLPTHRPLRRTRLANRIFASMDAKWAAVVEMVDRHHRKDRPVLVGTRSVEASEHLSRLLAAAGLPHEVLNARQDQAEAEIIARAGEAGRITVATNMAGRGTDIHLGRGVAERGGLLVIGTECHDARRIDRQLFGRCGRQGDPGTAVMFLSLEDDIVQEHGNRVLNWITMLLLKRPLQGMGRWYGPLLHSRAQCAAEHLHRRMRHELLKFDERVSTSLAFTGRTE